MVLYRYYNDNLGIHLVEFPVIRETPGGYWIDMFGPKKFVLKHSRKKFACITKSDALESLRCRKLRQQIILEHQLHDTKLAIYEIENIRLKNIKKEIKNG
jgi:hypothetical protein